MALDLYMSLYLIAEERGIVEKSPLTGRLIKLLEGIGLRLANLLIADTEEYLAYHLRTYGLKPEKFKIVPAGADDRIFYPRPELTPPRDYFRVIYYGTFIPNHGVPTMIQAASRLKEHSEIRFDLYVDGPERPLAENMAAELGLDNTHFHGWIEKDKWEEDMLENSIKGKMDDIDAQRCENCTYYDFESGDCDPLGIPVDDTFGCRDFVKKGK